MCQEVTQGEDDWVWSDCLGLLRYSYVEVYYMDMMLELVIMAG